MKKTKVVFLFAEQKHGAKSDRSFCYLITNASSDFYRDSRGWGAVLLLKVILILRVQAQKNLHIDIPIQRVLALLFKWPWFASL